MLQKLGDHIRGCYERAADCANQAASEKNAKVRADLLKMEEAWTHLAKSYEFVQRLEAFLLDTAYRRKKKRQTSPDAQKNEQ